MLDSRIFRSYFASSVASASGRSVVPQMSWGDESVTKSDYGGAKPGMSQGKIATPVGEVHVFPTPLRGLQPLYVGLVEGSSIAHVAGNRQLVGTVGTGQGWGCERASYRAATIW